jgi:hypothetical protein
MMLPGTVEPRCPLGTWLRDACAWIFSLEGLVNLCVIACLVMGILAILFRHSVQTAQ